MKMAATGIDSSPAPTESTLSAISLLKSSDRLSVPATSTLPLSRAASRSVVVVMRRMSASGAMPVTAMSWMLPMMTATLLPFSAFSDDEMPDLLAGASPPSIVGI